MTADQLRPSQILGGALFPEPVQVIVTIPMGDALKIIAKGLSSSTAKRLKKDYWLYVVFRCATANPSLNILHDPATLDWQPIVKASITGSNKIP